MPKKETKKNTKGTKSTNKSTVSKKVSTTKKTETKVEVKKTPTKVIEKEAVKPIENRKKSERKHFKSLVDKVMNNTPFAISLCIIVILIAVLIFVLCTKKVPKTSNGDDIIATVKGKTITAEDLYKSLKESYGTNALINLIDTYIADKEVTISKDDEEYVKEVVNYYKDYADYYGTDLSTFLASYVGITGISTEDEFYDYVLEDYKKTLAVQKLVGDSASEEELKEHYKENYSDTITAKHILIEVDQEAEDKEAADKEAYNKAVKLIKKLNETDKDKLNEKFEELAKENSDDTATYSNGGLIEDFSKTSVQEEFYNAANELKDGEYTDEPVKTSYGYHIILKVSSTPVKEFKDIKDDVKKSYAESLLSKDASLQVSKWDELRKQYKLSIEDDFIKDSYESTIKDASNKKTEEK